MLRYTTYFDDGVVVDSSCRQPTCGHDEEMKLWVHSSIAVLEAIRFAGLADGYVVVRVYGLGLSLADADARSDLWLAIRETTS